MFRIDYTSFHQPLCNSFFCRSPLSRNIFLLLFCTSVLQEQENRAWTKMECTQIAPQIFLLSYCIGNMRSITILPVQIQKVLFPILLFFSSPKKVKGDTKITFALLQIFKKPRRFSPTGFLMMFLFS